MNKSTLSRDNILEQVAPFIGQNVIKVITGQRRVGKSYLLRHLQHHITTPIIAIDKESYAFDFIRNYHDLIAYVESEASTFPTTLLIDEVQDIEEFEKALRHFQHQEGRYDIYCTGSNAHLLSGELATYLSGRYVSFTVHSLSFSEFCRFHDHHLFDDYLRFGGMPYLPHLQLNEEASTHYLTAIYQSIILKDVMQRHNLRNVRFLENLVQYLCTHIGTLSSANNIAAFLKNQRIKMNVSTVISYIDALKQCFFIHEAPRYDIVGKKRFEINHKYYVEDIGIRNAIVGYNQARDDGQLLENLVYMHLKRSGYTPYVGVLGKHEIDFVAERKNEKIYVQVALHVDSQNLLEREFGNLQRIPDNYPKYVVTRHATSTHSIDGIEHLSIEAFFEKVK